MLAGNRHHITTITLTYILVALAWLVIPDILFNGQAGELVFGGLAWDIFFIFVSASLLYFSLLRVHPNNFARLLHYEKLSSWACAHPHRLVLSIITIYTLLALLWLVIPDWLLDSQGVGIWIASGKDALFTFVTATLLFWSLRSLREEKSATPISFILPSDKWKSYIFSIIGSILVVMVRINIPPDFTQRPLLILFLIPIGLSAILGGLGPGLLATAISTGSIALLFSMSAGSVSYLGIDLLQTSLLVLNGVVLSMLGEHQSHARSRLVASLRALEAKSAELRQSEERFRTIFEGSPVAMGLSRKEDGRLIEINQAFRQLFHVDMHQAIGRTTQDLAIWFNPDDRTRLIAEMQNCQRISGAPVQLRKVNGETFHALLSWQLIQFGGDVYIHGAVLDVSKEHRIQESLRRSEHEFRLLMDAITDYAFFLLDPNGMVKSWSIGSQGIKGYSADEIIGRSFTCFYTKEDQDAGIPDSLLTYATENGRAEHEGWRIRRDGSRFWAKAVVYSIRDEAGLLVGFAKVTQDLTTHKAAEQELRDSEKRYASIVNSAMDGIITIDAVQDITFFNPAAEIMFGRKACDTVGQPLDILLPPAFRTAHIQRVKAFNQSTVTSRRTGSQDGKILGIRADGSVFPVETSFSKLELDGKRFITVVIRDISDRVQARTELETHLQHLESLNELGRVILAAQTPHQVAQLGLRYLRKLVPFWGATAMIIDWEEHQAQVLAMERAPGSSYNPGQRLSLFSYGLDDIRHLEKGEVCRVDELGSIPKRSTILERLYQQGMQSYIRIPLLAEGKLLGVMNLASKEPGAFTAIQQDLAEGYARQLAIALQQSLLRQHIEHLSRVYEVLSRINALIVRCHSRNELFDDACRIAVEVGAYQMAWLGIIDPSSQEAHVAAYYGKNDGTPQQINFSTGEDTIIRDDAVYRAVQSAKMVVCNDVQSTTISSQSDTSLSIHPPQAAAYLPIIVNGETTAILALYAREVGVFDKQETALLQELSDDIAFALDHILKEEKLDYLSYYDSLTGLANRSLLSERLTLKTIDAEREVSKLAVALLDIEHFRTINDVFGRRVGDHLLHELAASLTEHLGDANLLARYGSDQFVMMLPDTQNEEEVARRIDYLQQNCLGGTFAVIDDIELRLSAKFGVAMYPDDGLDSNTLLERAESALNRSKAEAKPFLFYRQEMTERALVSLALAAKLRQAIEREQFVLHYQPKYNARTHRLVSVEALIRWESPDFGLVPPAEFVPILEELGLIGQVGIWVLQRAVEDFHEWKSAGLHTPRIAVNVSPWQLKQTDFISTLSSILQRYPSENGIDLEITETQIMENIDNSIETLHQLRKFDLAIAIDDFGTGYSSLAYLAKLPVQALKIDRAFISSMLDQSETMTLVEMIISMAHAMSLEVIAEGVENQEQAEVLNNLGCDVLQGFWLSPPLSKIELTKKLQLAH
ncbi:EAL domain-containing protein [Chromobacterium piscinae]|uniref:EAL domain-containing protein n=1 Tax=Chromobacterium piscinae TaxID=686831 RepID=UPI003F8080F5